jgi:hypothetical protein
VALDSKAQMRAKYNWWESDSDVALMESARQNKAHANYLLAKHGQLDEQSRQKINFRLYTAMLELTVETATIPFSLVRAPAELLEGAVGTGVRSFGAAKNTTRVGRWMSEAEHTAMMDTGRVVESQLKGVTSVSSPPNPTAWVSKSNASPAFVEFDIPSPALQASDGVWGKIYGPNSMFGPKLGITEMPPATNIIRVK